MWNKLKAIEHLNQNAKSDPTPPWRCAQYVREAIEAGGVKLHHHASAKDYGSSLLHVGFHKIVVAHANSRYHHQLGDVAIIQPIDGHPDGHMAMFNGSWWVSDFTQYHGIYPNSSYRQSKPPYAIYRHP